MKPLHLAASGLVMVSIDFRLNGLDIVPDPIGWILVAAACWLLSAKTLAGASIVAALCSVPGVVLPYHFKEVETAAVSAGGAVRETTVEVFEFDQVTGGRLLLAAVEMAVGGIVLWYLVALLLRRATASGANVRTRLVRVRLVALGTWVVPTLIGMGYGAVSGHGFDPVWNDPVTSIALAGYVGLGALVVTLIAEAREPWARRYGTPLRRDNWSSRPKGFVDSEDRPM